MGKLKSVSKAENEILKIAGIGVLGVVSIYALVRSAPAIGDLFTKGINNIIGGIVSGLPSFGSGSTSTGSGTPLPGTAGTSLGGSTGITINNVTQALKDAGLPPAPTGTEGLLALGAVANQNQPGVLDTAMSILLGKQTNINLAGNPNLQNAENALVSQLSQNASTELVGQKPIGLFKVPGGDVVPLTQNAVDYYNKIHVGITEIVAY